MIEEDFTHFIELNPHPILLPAIRRNFEVMGVDGLLRGTLFKNENEIASSFETLAALYCDGRDIRWDRVFSVPRRPVPKSVRFPANDGKRTPAARLLPLSAHNREALAARAAALSRLLEDRQDISMNDLCYTVALHRAHHDYRLAAMFRHNRLRQLRRIGI